MTPRSIRETRQLAFDYLVNTPLVESDLSDGEFAIDAAFPEEFADTLSRLEAYNKHLFPIHSAGIIMLQKGLKGKLSSIQ